MALTLLSSSAIQMYATDHFVDLASPNATPPFASWATAATNLQDAVDAAASGDQVLVTNGVYSLGGRVIYGVEANRVVLTNGILLASVNGPLLTTISGGSLTRCVYVGSNSVLSGFTLRDGLTATSGDAIKEMSGGGIWCENGGVVTNCIIRKNTAANSGSGGGGGVYGGTLYNCTLAQNSGQVGGAVRGASLWNCTLTDNSSANGGASYQCVLRNCLVSRNTCTPAGGGTAFGTNYNCIIISNIVTGPVSGNQAYGGGTYRSDNYNCVIAGNSGLRGGGAYSGTLYNCTVVGNNANDGGGVHGNDILGYYTNCIIYFNTSPSGVNNWAGGVYDHCCLFPLVGGSASFTNPPTLLDWPNGFYQLNCGSPCIDTGADLSTRYTNDIRGVFRAIDGNGDALTSFDVGAYEYSPSLENAPAVRVNYTNCAALFPLSFKGGVSACAAFYWWDFGDGVRITNQNAVSHAWALPGSYTVQLTAYYAGPGQAFSTTTLVQVAQQEIHHVKPVNAAPAPPYSSWSTAATNIQDALNVAQMGDIVLVSNGVYNVGGAVVYGLQTNRVLVPDTVTLLSVNGPSATTIMGGTQMRCAYVGRDALLTGFTLSGGKARNSGNVLQEMSGGGIWCEEGASVSNCNFSANSAVGTSGGGGGAYGGTLYNCTFTGNTGFLGGAVRSAVLWSCALSGNSVQGISGGGGGAYSSVLYNCSLSNNLVGAYVNGAGAYQCILSNCLVKANATTPFGGGASGNGAGTCLGTNYNCILLNNAAGTNSGTGSGTGYGGGSYQSTNFNCLIIGNKAAASGGGAYQSGLFNCTVASNSAATSGGGIYSGTLNNTIIYFNTSPSGPNWAGSPFFSYCCTTPSAGSGGVGSDPLFVNAPGGAFELKFGSPCIDAGLSNSFTFGTSNDLAGAARPLDGDGNGVARIDIGAFEFNLIAAVGTNWFLDHGLNPGDPLVFSSDPDGDAFTTLQEWVAGTNPTNALSVLRLLPPTNTVSGFQVVWQSVTGKTYFLQRATDLDAPPVFSLLASNLVGQPVATRYTDPTATNGGPYFYRIGIQP